MIDGVQEPHELAEEILKECDGNVEMAVKVIDLLPKFQPQWPPTSCISYGFRSGYFSATIVEIKKQGNI